MTSTLHAVVPGSPRTGHPLGHTPARIREQVQRAVARELRALYPASEGWVRTTTRSQATWALHGSFEGTWVALEPEAEAALFTVKRGSRFGVEIRVQHTDEHATAVEILVRPAARQRSALPLLATLAGIALAMLLAFGGETGSVAAVLLWAALGFAAGFALVWSAAWAIGPLGRPNRDEVRSLLVLLVQSALPRERKRARTAGSRAHGWVPSHQRA